MINLRPYQQECKEALDTYRIGRGSKALIVCATGTGKRLMAVDYARNFKKVLFMVHREELIQQAYDDFTKEYGLDVGIIKGSQHELNKHITIGSVQTIYRRLYDIPKLLFDLVIVDECHHYLSKTYCETVMHFKCELLIGYTATPTRLDGLSMSNLFEKIVYEYPIDRAIKEGYLCKIDALRVKTEIDISKVHMQIGDFKSNELSAQVDIPQRNKLIAEKYTQYAKGKQAIAFGVDIAHAVHMRDTFIDHGYTSAVIHSKLSKEERSGIIEAFRYGEVDILTNCEILTEGFDYNDVGCLLMARPTKSLSLYMQMIGRSTRLKSEKFVQKFGLNQATILDFVDNVGKHDLINCWNIDSAKPLEDRIFMSDERKNKLLEKKEQWLEEQRTKRKMLIDKFYKNDKRVDLLALPVEKQIDGDWKRLDPTEKQIKYLMAVGIYDPSADYTRGQCSEIISALQATDAQKATLAKFGYNILNGCTKGQAKLVFDELVAQGKITRSTYDRKTPSSPVNPPPFKLF